MPSTKKIAQWPLPVDDDDVRVQPQQPIDSVQVHEDRDLSVQKKVAVDLRHRGDVHDEGVSVVACVAPQRLQLLRVVLCVVLVHRDQDAQVAAVDAWSGRRRWYPFFAIIGADAIQSFTSIGGLGRGGIVGIGSGGTCVVALGGRVRIGRDCSTCSSCVGLNGDQNSSSTTIAVSAITPSMIRTVDTILAPPTSPCPEPSASSFFSRPSPPISPSLHVAWSTRPRPHYHMSVANGLPRTRAGRFCTSPTFYSPLATPSPRTGCPCTNVDTPSSVGKCGE